MARTLILIVSLLLSFVLRVWLAATPIVPVRQPLADFPHHLGQWELAQEGSISARLEPVLGADDYLLRSYRNPSGQVAEFFTAYYKEQKAGENMHSPKNCLSGAAWEPLHRGRVTLGADGAARPASVNSFVIEREGQRYVMLYWFQA